MKKLLLTLAIALCYIGVAAAQLPSVVIKALMARLSRQIRCLTMASLSSSTSLLLGASLAIVS